MSGVRSTLAYAPGASPFHRAAPGAALAFIGAYAATAFMYGNPLVLLTAGLALAFAGAAAGAGRALRGAARLAIPLIVLMVVVNALTFHRGETVLLRGWELPLLGGTDVTLESIAAGGVIGLRVVIVIVAFAIWSACVNPDRVLSALRPVARRSALTAALISRLLPVAAADLARLRDAAGLRGPAAAPAGRGALARKLVAGSLDRSVDLAATLELRGHSLPQPKFGGARRAAGDRGADAPGPRRAARRTSAGVALGALACIGAAAAGLLLGAAEFQAVPELRVEADLLTAALCAALLAAAAMPWAWPLVRGRAVPAIGGHHRRRA